MATSRQQELILEQKYFVLNLVMQAGESLDRKGMGMMQAAGVLLALAGVIRLPAFVLGPVNGWQAGAVGVAFLSFAGLLGLTLWAWRPGRYALPGVSDRGELQEVYLGAEEEDAFLQVLGDCVDAIEAQRQANGWKARRVRWAMVLFVVQVVGLLGLAIWA